MNDKNKFYHLCLNLADGHKGKFLSDKYITAKTKYLWKCNNDNHKPFLTTYDQVKRNRWCPQCKNEKTRQRMTGTSPSKETREKMSNSKKEFFDNFQKKYIGMKFNKLVIIDITRSNRKSYCICKCECGKIIKARLDHLMDSHIQSCGCLILSKESRSKRSKSASKRIQEYPETCGSSRGKEGWFFSIKNNKKVHYRSSYELIAYQILEQMSIVKSYEIESIVIPYMYNDVTSNYIPDILVVYMNGEKELIEIKPEYKLTDKKNIIKFEAAKLFTSNNNMKFSVWTEKQLKLVA